MLDENGVDNPLTNDEALAIILDLAGGVGLAIPQASVEDILAIAFGRFFLFIDNAQGQSVASQTRPQTLEAISVQNPGNPPLLAKTATSYLHLVNTTGSPVPVALNTIFTASNGNTYTTGNNTVTVAGGIGQSANIGIESIEKGISQNIPAGLAFTGVTGLTGTNPIPIDNGRDDETAPQYLSRIIDLQTNFTSQNTTIAAEREIRNFYRDARILINNSPNATTTPIPKPAQGYTAVVLTPSGVNADSNELTRAFEILSNRFQFTNAFSAGTSFHPIKQATIYTGSVPAEYFLVPAQPVTSTISAILRVNFAPFTDAIEKKNQAFAFAQFFAQNLLNFFSGTTGTANVTFTPLDYYSPVSGTVNVNASNGFNRPIGPAFSIELIRALIMDAANLPSLTFLNYLACDALEYILSSSIAYEPTYTLDIAAGLKDIDFNKTALFSDNTSWFDRFILLSPSSITIEVVEDT